MKITYKTGDITKPSETSGNNAVVICHCVNDTPVMGSGVAAALYNKWPVVREAYMSWGNGEPNKSKFRLGEIQLLYVDKNTYVCNLVGQRDTIYMFGIAPIRYEAIREGLYKLKDFIDDTALAQRYKQKFTVVLPRIGCNLAGGSWAQIEPIINEVFLDTDYKVVVYTHGPFNP